MSLFHKKQSTTKATPPAPPEAKGDATVVPAQRSVVGAVRLTPYLTEKSSSLAGQGTYTFIVPRDAEKISIARAVTQRYGVTPTRVHILRTAGKDLRYGRTAGHRSGVKKAMVTLKKGATIPFGVKT